MKKKFAATGIVFVFAVLSFMEMSLLHGSAFGGTIFWTDEQLGVIRKANLDGTGLQTLVSGLDRPEGIALDMDHLHLYWTVYNSKKIQRSGLDGSGVETVLDETDGLGNPIGLALDLTDARMYWTEYYPPKICRADLDGANREVLLDASQGLTPPVGIALDTAAGKMYWASHWPGTICRANLDGSGSEVLLSAGLEYPFGVALDFSNSLVYWTDYGIHKIQKSDLNGLGVADVLTNLSYPDGIAVDSGAGKLYWADAHAHKLLKAGADGTGVQELFTAANGLGMPVFLAINTLPAVVESVTPPVLPTLVGQTARLTAYICNVSSQPLPPTARTRYYVTGPGGFSQWVGEVSAADLAAGWPRTCHFFWSVPTDAAAGFYTFFAEVWDDAKAISNALASTSFEITRPSYNIQVLSLWPVGSPQIAGAKVLLKARVKNNDTSAIPTGTLVHFYITGPHFGGVPTSVGTKSCAGLAPGSAVWYFIYWNTAGVTPGTYIFTAQVKNSAGDPVSDVSADSVTFTISP